MQLGSTVSLIYTGTLNDGTVFGYAKRDNPLTFQTGMDLVIDGLEKHILEMESVGQKATFTLSEYEAYGEYDQDNIAKVPLEQIPPGRAVVGNRTWIADSKSNNPIPAQCIAIEEGVATFDMNHPLAGKCLTFDVEIIAIEDAPEGFVSVAQKRAATEQGGNALGLRP